MTFTRGDGNVPPFLKAGRLGDAMTPDEVETVIKLAVQDAVNYVDTELSPERTLATEYYQGKPFGNEEDGRSQAILTEVRDGILGVLPSILRVIHGPEHVVEFVPKRADTVAMADQATDYVRYVYEEDNAGFLVTHSTIKDGLLKRLGIVKWGMDESPKITTTAYRGLTRDDLALLADGAELTAVTDAGNGLVNVEVTTTVPAGRAWVMPVPPDDFFWNREARSLDDAVLVGHRTRPTHSELRAMGVSQQDIEDYAGVFGITQATPEEVARRTDATSGFTLDPEMGEENRRALYCEVYMKLNVTGKGATLRKICTLGPTFQPISNRPVDERPFGIFNPDPEPHAFLGGSWFDRLKDVQKIKSSLLRGMLDSLSISLFPRPVYVDGQASVADILNTSIGAPVRERQPGMVRWDAAPFTGEKVMPIMAFMQEVVERRIGQKDGAGSLDLDALQSTGAEAVNAAITAATAQPELLARLFAEQVLKPMFRGLLKLAALPESKERIVRLRGNYVPVRPATWDAGMDVSVNVALGSMDTAKKIGVLKEVIADQSAILEKYGPSNPVVTLSMLRNAKAKVLELQGIKDVEHYYQPIPPDWQPPPPPAPSPSPDELWMQTEKQMASEKTMKELAIKEDELRLKEQEKKDELRLKEEELAQNAHFRDRELDLKEAMFAHEAHTTQPLQSKVRSLMTTNTL